MNIRIPEVYEDIDQSGQDSENIQTFLGCFHGSLGLNTSRQQGETKQYTFLLFSYEIIEMTYIQCGTHGRQKQTFVCSHIIETLRDGEPRGFWWSFVDSTYEAICSACNDLDEKAFREQLDHIGIEPLCYGCFRQVAELNGIILE